MARKNTQIKLVNEVDLRQIAAVIGPNSAAQRALNDAAQRRAAGQKVEIILVEQAFVVVEAKDLV